MALTDIKLTISVISLATSVGRRSLVMQDLRFHGSLKWSFFDALDHASPVAGLESNCSAQLREYGRPLTDGEVGCFKSHFTLLSNFLRQTASDWLLVVEDDVWFDPDFSVLEIVDLAEMRGLNYIRLFAKMYKPADVVETISNLRQLIRFRTDPYGAQAYLINRRGCMAFLDSINAIILPFDDELGRFWRHGLDAYCIFPFPAVERSVPSALTANRNASSADRAHLTPTRLLGRIASRVEKAIYNARYKLTRKRLHRAMKR